jgi:hypothetical protein
MADSKEGVVAPVPIFFTVTLPVTDFPGVPLGTEIAVTARSVEGCVTVTVTLFERFPELVTQFNVYVVVTTGKTTCEPVVILSVSGRLPLQPPAFVQDVILIATPLVVPP